MFQTDEDLLKLIIIDSLATIMAPDLGVGQNEGWITRNFEFKFKNTEPTMQQQLSVYVF